MSNMKNYVLNLENERDVLNFVSIIDYGSNHFVCKDDEILNFVKNCATILNEAYGSVSFRIEKEELVDMLEFYEVKRNDGLYRFVSSIEKEFLPNLHDDSFYMVKYMNQAFNEKRRVRLSLDDSLFKYARKMAKNDVVFDTDEDSPFFMCAKRELSIYEQIKRSFYRGDDYIKFDSENISVATVRCYASTISKLSGKKFRCNIDEGYVTIYFKKISDSEDAEKRIIQILENLKTHEEICGILLTLNSRFVGVNGIKDEILEEFEQEEDEDDGWD